MKISRATLDRDGVTIITDRVTQRYHLTPRTGRLNPPHSETQTPVPSAIPIAWHASAPLSIPVLPANFQLLP